MAADARSRMREVYRHHHTTGERLGRTVMEEIRAPFFKKHIGTGKYVLDVGCRDGTLTKHFVGDNRSSLGTVHEQLKSSCDCER